LCTADHLINIAHIGILGVLTFRRAKYMRNASKS